MEAIERAAVGRAGATVLADGGLKDGSGQPAELEWLHAAEHVQLRQVGSMPALAELAAPPAGMELDRRLQFGERRRTTTRSSRATASRTAALSGSSRSSLSRQLLSR
jgi:hypothetical protein